MLTATIASIAQTTLAATDILPHGKKRASAAQQDRDSSQRKEAGKASNKKWETKKNETENSIEQEEKWFAPAAANYSIIRVRRHQIGEWTPLLPLERSHLPFPQHLRPPESLLASPSDAAV